MARSSKLGHVLLAAAVLVAVGGGVWSSADARTSDSGVAGPSASGAGSASRVAHPGTNLLRNGGAETGANSFRGYDEVVIPGWKVTKGLPTVIRYGIKGFLARSSPGPSKRGRSYFAGGSGGTSRLHQNVPLASPHGGPLPRGTRVRISGWLGGLATSRDDASVVLTFRDAHGSRLGETRLGPVRRVTRRGRTALVHVSRAVHVPVGARSVRVSLVLTTAATNYDGPHGSVPGADHAWADNLSLTATAPVREPRPIVRAKGFVPTYKHVFVVMMENQDYSNIIGNLRQAPFLNSLLPQGTSFASMYAEVHPSDPNYLALAAGSTFHVMGDPIESHRDYLIDAPNIGDLVQNAGETWRAYYQGAHGPCDNTIHRPYYNDDLPFLYFQDIRSNAARCDRHLVPLKQMAVDLHSTATTPSFAWWGANDCRDMEGCGIKSGDSFLKKTVGEIRASPAWRNQRSILFVTFDEDRYDKERPAQLIPTIAVASKGVRKGYVSRVRYDHYNMLRTIERALGLGTLTKNDLYARPMSDIFRRQGK